MKILSHHPPTFPLTGQISRGEWVKIKKKIKNHDRSTRKGIYRYFPWRSDGGEWEEMESRVVRVEERKREKERNPTPPHCFFLQQAKANTLLASKLILHLPRIPPIVISEKGKTMERLCFDHTTEVYASKYFRINFKKGIENL